MEQKGVFRSALGGFHKQDVLNYIDGITAEWNEERQQLTAQAEADRELAQQQQDAAAEAVAALEAAQAAADTATKENEALRGRLQELEAELIDLRQLPEQVRALTEQLQEVTAQRDVATAEKANLTEQLHIETDRANTATSEMMAAEERLQMKEQELGNRDARINELERSQTHYQAILNNAEDAGRRVEGIARPFIRQAGQQASEALEDIQGSLTALLEQLNELQGHIEEKKTNLNTSIDHTDSQMNGAITSWVATAKEAVKSDNVTGTATDFFR